MKKNKIMIVLAALLVLLGVSCSADSLTDIGGWPLSGDDVHLLVVNTNGSAEGKAEDAGHIPSPKAYVPAEDNRAYVPAFYRKEAPLKNALNFRSAVATEQRSGMLYSTWNGSSETYNHVYDYANGTTVGVTRVASGTNCIIFCQTTKYTMIGDVGSANWQSLANYFDDNYATMIGNFGAPANSAGNGKIVITYFDMKGLGLGTEYEWVCGYFYSGDLYDLSSYGYTSNEMDVINMNLTWGLNYAFEGYNEGESKILHNTMQTTLVHEFQHLINESNRYYVGKTMMDTWLDEGLAQAAEQLCEGAVLSSRIEQFNADGDGSNSNLVRNGNSLVDWEGDYADYSMSYMFMQYAKYQYGGEALYKLLINDSKGDYNGITGLLKGKNDDYSDFSDIVRGYYVANLLQQDSGTYAAYLGADNVLKVSSPTSKISDLRPSAAIYLKDDLISLQSALKMGDEGDNVEYVLTVDGKVYYVESGKWVPKN